MSTTMVPPPPAPPKKTNRIGLEVLSYKGGKTTLCAGCGHNSISERIIECFYELGVERWMVAKFSGTGCSLRWPAYFLTLAHGLSSVHGRMPSVATGAVLANRRIIGLGVTGDGDTASIGLGQFMHLLRRNLPLIYIIEDNGVYGLTKGQFSATADLGSKLKTGVINDLPPFDCCTLGRDSDTTNKTHDLTALHEADQKGEVLTGVLYVDTSKPTFLDMLNMAEEPLATLPESKTRPSKEALDQIMEELR